MLDKKYDISEAAEKKWDDNDVEQDVIGIWVECCCLSGIPEELNSK